MNQTICFGRNTIIQYNPEEMQFRIHTPSGEFVTKGDFRPDFLTAADETVLFSEAQNVNYAVLTNGIGTGLQTVYSAFAAVPDVTIETYLWVEDTTGDVYCEIRFPEGAEKIKTVRWPAPLEMSFSKEGYAALPIQQGFLLMDTAEDEVKNYDSGRFGTRECTMPWWGQTDGRKGYMAIMDTPWDANFMYHHLPGESSSLNVVWESSLGSMSYCRRLIWKFYKSPTYVTFCKAFRRYAKEKGEVVTTREKIRKNRHVNRLVGATVINTDIAHWNCEPTSDMYNNEDPSQNHWLNPFGQLESRLREMYEAGLRDGYVHIDGWGTSGYDNQHPDVLPPSEEAGGAEGLKSLFDTIRDMGWMAVLHDQYRDYYVTARTFNEDQAVMAPDGSIPYCYEWPGGKQAYLCATLAPHYLRRNYQQLREMDLLPDGAYLDVFSVSQPDECANPRHRMTRRECMAKRNECFDYLRTEGLVVSSEEPVYGFISHMDLTHHGPYAYAVWEYLKVKPFGRPAPLVNLVYHDCILLPWQLGYKVWGLPAGESGFLHALLNGGMPAVPFADAERYIRQAELAAKLHREIALSEMVSHEFLDGEGHRQRTVFVTGTVVEVDFAKATFSIRWRDGSVTEGADADYLCS